MRDMLIGRTLILLVAVACLDRPVGVVDTTLPSPASPRANQLSPLGVQLHVHGLSNHNSATTPGSMDWELALAARQGLSAIWWSDHADVFSQPFDFPIHLEQAAVAPGYHVVFGPRGEPTYQRPGAFVPAWVGGTPSVAVDSGVLTLGIARASDTGRAEFQMRLVSAAAAPLIQTSLFARPMLGRPAVLLDVSVSDTAALGTLRVILDMGKHASPQPMAQRVVWELARGISADTLVLGDSAVIVRVPLGTGSGGFQSLLLDVAGAMARLRDGDDNTISVLTFVVLTDSGRGRFSIRNLRLRSLEQNRVATIGLEETLALRYRARYGLLGPIGFEEHRFLDLMPNGEPPHVSGFFKSGGDLPGVLAARGASVSSFVGVIHAAGGLVSLNHPFGTSPSGNSGAPNLTLVDSVASRLASVRLWDADLLEVGYPHRGFANLIEHLELWDELARQGRAVCAVGSSDSHGGVPTDPGQFGQFATWVWVREWSQDGIWDGLRSCAVYFGDPTIWNGTFDLQVGSAFAGSSLTNPGDTVSATAYVTTSAWSRAVGLVQTRLVTVMQDGSTRYVLVSPGRRQVVSTVGVVLVRAELWTTDGRPVAFTNPVWLQ
jgi:hypothetical protein